MKYLILLTLIFILSCSKESNYAYYENLSGVEVDNRVYPLSLLQNDKNIDVLLVIDNSGSMSSIQKNVILNSRIFLEQFAKQSLVNWKIGLISTDKGDTPYLGFDKSFDSTLITYNDPYSFDRTVSKFQDAVSELGIRGDADEYVFYNIKRVIDLYNGSKASTPTFLRPNSHLVVIMITDEQEQSMKKFGKDYDVPNFVNIMKKHIANKKVLRFYGALSRKDLAGCATSGDSELYVGSPYEAIINLTSGFNISACVAFGNDLARIGKDIASLVGLPSLLLKQRPVSDTIRIFYKGLELSPGSKESGGVWYYEEDTNTINFYTMDFVDDPRTDYFKIEFDIDDGHDRE